jgi:hypothetical protein
MSRDIKFRAWVTHYDEPFMLYLTPFKQRYDYENGFVYAFAEHSSFWGNENYETKDAKFEIMQFTGLKDKNGKEIYEADTDGHGNVVEFCNGSFCLNGDRLIHSGFEVKGNIYEHPELLKQ